MVRAGRAVDFTLCLNSWNVVPPLSLESIQQAEGPARAWELEDDAGNTWVLQVAILGIPEGLFQPGDELEIGSRMTFDLDRGSREYVVFEREGLPVLFLAYGIVPVVPSTPDFAIAAGDITCGAGRCEAMTTARVTIAGESADIEPEGMAEISGMLVRSDGFVDNSDCTGQSPSGSDFLVAGYRIP